LHVEHSQPRYRAQGICELIDDVGTTPFAHIRDALDDGHGLSAYCT
jgi:hypothetical protein